MFVKFRLPLIATLSVFLFLFATTRVNLAQDGVIYIGGIHPLTGSLAADGNQMDNAIRMAIDEINLAGGVLGNIMLEYLSADSMESAEVGQAEAERLIANGVSALIGAFQPSVTGNVAAIAEREGVPLVIDVAVDDTILDQGYAYVFRLQPNATTVGANSADYLAAIAEELGERVTTAVYLFEGTTGYGDDVRAAFAERAREKGIEIIDQIAYDPFDVTDFTTEMTLINALAPDVLLVTGYYNDGLLAARNARDEGLQVKAVFGVGQGAYDTSQFIEDARDLTECFFNSNYHWDASNSEATVVRAAFEETFDEEMRTPAVLAYQAVYIIADAIERSGSANSSDIRDALAETDYADHILPYEGAIEFDAAGENIVASPVLMQIQGGEVLQVWPPEFAESEPRFCTSWGR